MLVDSMEKILRKEKWLLGLLGNGERRKNLLGLEIEEHVIYYIYREKD